MTAILSPPSKIPLALIDNPSTPRLIAVLGTITVCRLAFALVSWLYGLTRRSSVDDYQHCARGSWVLVTGGSDGIGLGFVEGFLARGFNVLVHGRNPEKLQSVKKDLQLKHPRSSVETVVADASKADDSFRVVAEKAANLPGKLTILVNNVGGQSAKPQHATFWDMPHTVIDSDLNINARFPTHLTSALIPLLRRNGPSLIMNCGSVGGLFGVPYLAVYSATKAYTHIFTSGLKNDFAAEGVTNVEIIGLTIGPVVSATNKPDASSFFTLSSRECAEGCIAQIGRGRLLAFSSWKHEAQVALINSMPDFLWRRLMVDEMKHRAEDERVEQ